MFSDIIQIIDMYILSGLIGVGSIMNNKEVQVHNNINTSRVKRTLTNGNNLYDNAKYRTIKSYENNVAYDRYKLSQDPMNTGVIPNFYNQLQTVIKRQQSAKNEYLKQKKAREERRNKKDTKVEGFESENNRFIGKSTKLFICNTDKIKIGIIILSILLIIFI